MAMDIRTMEKRVKVAIIGGGISGIGAANWLMSERFDDFVLLEGSDRLGGRILSIDLDSDRSRRVELGANWIRDNMRNPIYEIAMANSLLSTHNEERNLAKKMMFLTETGDPVNAHVVQDVDLQYGQLMAECRDFYRKQIPTPFEADSVGAFAMREFAERICCYKGQEHDLRMMIFDQRLLTECMICGADTMHDVALSEVGCFEDLPGTLYVIPPGFDTIIDVLKRNVPESRILLNRHVSRITWDQCDQDILGVDDCVPEENENSGSAVNIECADGTKIIADICLVTVSLGYLKAHAAQLFNPPLPNIKSDAISHLAMGTVDKVILEFDGRLLPEDVFCLEMLWDRSNSKNEEISKNWIKKIGSFEAVSDNVIIGWLSGREAEYMETLEEEEVGRTCVDAIKKFLSHTAVNLPKLTKVSRSMWMSNPFTLGSYCYVPVGASNEDIVALGAPVNNGSDKPVLLFAGEATHPTFYSSSHGALLSGRREAQRILTILNSS